MEGSIPPSAIRGCGTIAPDLQGQFSIINPRHDGRELASFAELHQWVVWKLVNRDGKLTKVPFSPWAPYPYAKSNDPATWGTRAQAEAALREGGFSGIGIMFGKLEDDPKQLLAGIDFDSCVDPKTGKIEPWAAELIDRFKTYCEYSPSGGGVKLFFLCSEQVLRRSAAKTSMVSMELSGPRRAETTRRESKSTTASDSSPLLASMCRARPPSCTRSTSIH